MSVSFRIALIRHTPEPERLVALSARMCYGDMDFDAIVDANHRSEPDKDAKFLAKLLSSNHLSPLEHASFTFLVSGVSRALLAQLTRHRIASFSVQSQRYVSVRDAQYVVPPRIQQLGEDEQRVYKQQMETISSFYEHWMDELGESGKEDARFVLPNAAPTKLIMTMNARELLHFFSLRCCRRAQWEIRALACAMLALVKRVAPALFERAGPGCVSGQCPEGGMTCGEAAKVRKKIADIASLDANDEAAILKWAED